MIRSTRSTRSSTRSSTGFFDSGLDNLTPEEQAFRNALVDSGVPVTDEALRAEFQRLADAENLRLSNNSPYSPFWRLITSVAIKPVIWLTAFTVRFVLPQSFAKLATGQYLDWFAWSHNTGRLPASRLQGELLFERDTVDQLLTIPADTWIRTPPIHGHVYRVRVTADTDFPVNVSQIRVPVEAEQAGAAWNLAAGYFTTLETPIAGIATVNNDNDWITRPGTDLESDEDLRYRLRNRFTALSNYHVDAVYRSIIAEQIGFRPERIFFRHNAPRGPGSADAFVLFDTGVPAQEFLDRVNDYISNQGHHGHGDDLRVQALPETQHDVSAELWVNQSLDSLQLSQLQFDVEQCIRAAFRENSDYTVTRTRPYARFSFSQLDRELHQLFPDLRSIQWGQDDLISDLDVPRLNTLILNWHQEALW